MIHTVLARGTHTHAIPLTRQTLMPYDSTVLARGTHTHAIPLTRQTLMPYDSTVLARGTHRVLATGTDTHALRPLPHLR